MKSKKILLLLLFGIALVFVWIALLPAQYVNAQGETPPPPTSNPVSTPVPNSTPGTTPVPSSTPTPSGGVTTSIVQSFVNLVFPVDTINKALGQAISTPVDEFSRYIQGQAGAWALFIGGLLSGPGGSAYAKVANEHSLPIAAAIAVPLFLLRLAMYQWHKLTGEDDRIMAVLGDWVRAGLFAALCGYFLDLVVRLGWWMCGAVIGDVAALSMDYVRTMMLNIGSTLYGAAMSAWIFPVIMLTLELAGIVAIGGLLLAFIIAQGTLFILAIVGPIFFVASVIPQLKWLEGLWIKAVTIIALLPLLAGGIFRATVELASVLTYDSLLSGIVRVAWMLATTGALLSVVGILGKFTIGATTDAIQGMLAAVKAVADLAIAAGTGGASLAAGGAAAAGGGAAVAGGGGAAAAAGGGGGGGAAAGHLAQAGLHNQQAGLLNAFGFGKSASMHQTLSRGHDLEARRLQLEGKMQGLDRPEPKNVPDEVNLGRHAYNNLVHEGVESKQMKTFLDSPKIKDDLDSLHISATVLGEQAPGDLAKTVEYYAAHQEEVDKSDYPLLSAANGAHATHIINMYHDQEQRASGE